MKKSEEKKPRGKGGRRLVKSYNLKLLFIIITFAIYSFAAAAAALIVLIAGRIIVKPMSIPNFIWVAILSVVIGLILSVLVSKMVLSPITRLEKAMSEVAKGDFTVRLEHSSKIEEIKRSYNSFNIMVKELGSTEILQADFVSEVSHEFRTPINAIEGYAMLLQSSDRVTAEQQEYIDKILFNTRRLTELTGGILLLSKIENSAIEPRCGVFSLDEQIRQAIVSLEMKWQKKGIEFDVDLDGMKINGNANLLSHVWLNLIDNAVKFSPEGGTVKMSLKGGNDAAVFTISDSGPGIKDKDMGHIFDKFFRADNSDKKEGNGLGLALVKRIVNIHKGNIEVYNNAGGGAVFTVRLPLNINPGKS